MSAPLLGPPARWVQTGRSCARVRRGIDEVQASTRSSSCWFDFDKMSSGQNDLYRFGDNSLPGKNSQKINPTTF